MDPTSDWYNRNTAALFRGMAGVETAALQPLPRRESLRPLLLWL